MPSCAEVVLPRVRPALFPARCIVCGQSDLATTYRVPYFGTQRWLAILRACAGAHQPGATSGLCHADVPVCESCPRQLRWESRRIRLVVATVMLLGVGFCFSWFGTVREPFIHLLICLGTGLVCTVPIVGMLLFFPPAIIISVFGEEFTLTNYRFRDHDYAREFAALNDACVEERWM